MRLVATSVGTLADGAIALSPRTKKIADAAGELQAEFVDVFRTLVVGVDVSFPLNPE